MAHLGQTDLTNAPGLSYAVVDVFTNERMTGNQLAIVHLAGKHLSQAQKQAIAKEFNYSETTFVQGGPREEVNSYHLNIFTTTEELPFAGHPVIGSAVHILSNLASKSGVVKGAFITKAGRIDLEYDDSTGAARAAIPHDVRIHSNTYPIDELKRLQPSVSRLPAFSPVVSIVKGMTFVLVELDSLDSLQFVNTTPFRVNTPLDDGWGDSFAGTYFYYRLASADGSGTLRLRTRMIEAGLEDAATGSAACTLASYLSLTESPGGRNDRYEIIQGVEMGRKSEIFVEVKLTKEKKIDAVYLSGSAVQTMEGKIVIE
jgi:PhzF family phenazine biosynthesis protein